MGIKLNGRILEIKEFPNKEVLINISREEIQGDNEKLINHLLEVKFESNQDLMNLIFVKKWMDENGFENCELKIPYLPYSRMDRVEGNNVFTLKYLAEIINSLKFKKVITWEAHSDVCLALIDRVINVPMSSELVKDILHNRKDKNDVILVYPDAGALKRYSKQIKHTKVLAANKERDFKTGYIKKLDIVGDVPKNGFNAIIVDDLCSKGGTFMLTAQKLKELGANKIELVVTHCENSIFDGDILRTDLIDKVYTTRSIISKSHEKIKIIL